MSDVVDLIMKDHREFERMLAQMESDPTSRATVLPVFATLLTAHSRAEENEVYPAASAADGADDVAHSQEEHVEADRLVERLQACDPDSAEFAELLAEVAEAVTHHLEEEEETVLPHLRERLDDDRLQELGEAFLTSREEHLGAGPGDITRAEVQQQARNMELEGTSGMTKDELQRKLLAEAESEE
ncbi:hemerythrin domain-containing protein [Nocardioides daphniae]|uniref:Hemerythrin-like domain-containing protein n=1 Tax=Nocardioides daphniae TaxID=402297 RepID=A0ABQ1QMN7_9ACTN|nr:hemerythrin domain-containing protein [Nocardioides daphniae]GGD31087.1 hypothetical protein GCM10007231_33290 [Nocardioides daphniae]